MSLDKLKLEIGQRIQLFARTTYNSLPKLEAAIGKSRNTLQQYVNGRSLPGGEILCLLMQQGCSINWLLTGTGDMHFNPESNTSSSVASDEVDILRKENNALKDKIIMLQEKLIDK